MMPTLRLSIVAFALVAMPVALAAQGRARPTQAPSIPANMRPPAGKCRIWMESVSPSQQPAPTDCQTALRQKPANGTVVFGPPLENKGPERFQSRQTPRPDTVRTRRDSTRTRPDTARSRPQPARPRTPSRTDSARTRPPRADTSRTSGPRALEQP